MPGEVPWAKQKMLEYCLQMKNWRDKSPIRGSLLSAESLSLSEIEKNKKRVQSSPNRNEIAFDFPHGMWIEGTMNTKGKQINCKVSNDLMDGYAILRSVLLCTNRVFRNACYRFLNEESDLYDIEE